MSTTSDPPETHPGLSTPIIKLSPARQLIVLAALIFLAELVAMVILYFLQIPNYAINSLLDGIIMLVLITPGLYVLQLKPILKNVEDRDQAEHALRRSENLFRKVLELLPVGVWITDKDGKIVHGNPASQQIWGSTRYVGIEKHEDYIGWWVNTGKQIDPEEWASARAITRGETSLNEEIEIESADGTRKIILNSALPILDDRRVIQGAVIVNQDITRRRKTERELINKNELLERFFSGISTLIAYMDREFNFIRVNDTYANAGGHPPAFFIGKNHFDLYPNEENQAIFQQVVETDEPFFVLEKQFEYPEYPERGTTYWDWGLQPVKGANGAIEGVVLSLVDVTERKLSEIQLERQNQELRELTNAERRQRELAEGLVQATMVLNTSLELDQVLYSILEQIRRVFPFQGAEVVLVEDTALQVASFIGFEDHPDGLPLKDKLYTLDDYPLLQQVYSSHQPVIIDSVTDYLGWQMKPGREWVRSYAAIPLIVGSELIGNINLNSEHPGQFSPKAVQWLLAFAAPAALALHNARLYQAETAARQFAETLSAAAQGLSQTLSLEHVINTLLDHLCTLLPSDSAGVILLENEVYPVIHTLRGYKKWVDHMDIPTIPIGGDVITSSVIRRLESARKSLVILNPVSDSAPVPSDSVNPMCIHSWLIMPIIASDKLIGWVELGRTEDEVFNPEHIRQAEALVFQATVALQNARLFEQIQSSRERMQSLAHKLVKIQENERYHIARELHDEAGQALSSLKINLRLLEQESDCSQSVRKKLAEMKGMADSVLEELHRLAMDLRPATLDHLGLVAALAQHINHLNPEKLSVQFKAVGFERVRLVRDVEISLYRIVQETLTNVIRHAHARTVGILLERVQNSVKLFIEDDGVGFSLDAVEQKDRLGLVGIRERAEMLGGSLTIESSPGKGTSIIVEVPNVCSDPDNG